MRAVITQVSPDELEQRRKLGIDRWDEMWEGVLHMPPSPTTAHQRILMDLVVFFHPLIERKGQGILIPQLTVFDPAWKGKNYRIPDLSFVAAGRESIIADQGIEGGPDAVIEIRSPDDETYEKSDFFAGLGVGEMIVVDRDSKTPELFRLAGSAFALRQGLAGATADRPKFAAVAPDRDGWVISEAMGVRMRRVSGERPRLAVEDIDDPSARTEI